MQRSAPLSLLVVVCLACAEGTGSKSDGGAAGGQGGIGGSSGSGGGSGGSGGSGGKGGSGGSGGSGGAGGSGGSGGPVACGSKTCGSDEACDRPCGAKSDSDGTCVALAKSCASEPAGAECGCNGKLYDNKCFRLRDGYGLAAAGSCSADHMPPTCNTTIRPCKDTQFCDLAMCTGPSGGGCYDKADTCTGGGGWPVCGCDGKTYENECLRRAAGVIKAKDGDC